MIVPDELAAWYRFHQPYLTHAHEAVRTALAVYCESQGFASLVRIKTLDSLSEKVEGGRIRSIWEIDDLVAAAVIVPDLTRVEPTIQRLRSLFAVQYVRGRGSSKKPPDAFRFEATRVVCRFVSFEGDNRPTPLRDILFEIQVRTAFEHAWSVTTHEFSYKSAVVDWKRLRLAAQLKALVEQADLMVLGFDRTLELVHESPWAEISQKLTIAAALAGEPVRASIPPEVLPKDWSRFIDNIHALLDANYLVRETSRLERALATLVSALCDVPAAEFPRSLSLFQTCYGLLRTAGVIQETDRHPVFVSDAMRVTFPVTRADVSGFQLSPQAVGPAALDRA